MKSIVLALLLAGALAESECVGCGAAGRRIVCANGSCSAAMEFRYVETGVDVAAALCKKCGTPNEPRALNCCSKRRLREDADSILSRRMACRRYIAGDVEGLQCESAMEAYTMVAASCFRYMSPAGDMLDAVQCEGEKVDGQLVKCVRDRNGLLMFCQGPRDNMACSAKQDDAAASECGIMMESEEAASGGVVRLLGGNKHGNNGGEVTVVNLNDPRYFNSGRRYPNSRVVVTPMPHNPWSPDNIAPMANPVIRQAPLRPIAPTPIMLLDHQLPADASMRRLSLVAPDSRPRCTPDGCGPTVTSAPAVVVQRDTVSTVVRETSCPEGMSLEGNVCVGLDICPVQYTCPGGFIQSDAGDCVSEAQPAVECPSQYTLHGGKVCTKGSVMQASYVCSQSGYVLDNASKMCVKEIPQAPTCPAGYSKEGSGCVRKYAPQVRCATGILSGNGECVSKRREPASMECPAGSQQVGSDGCISVSQKPAYCPSGFDKNLSGNCVKALPKVPGDCPSGFTRRGRQCERVERSAAESICPTTADYELRGNVCHREIPQESRCAAGTQKSSYLENTCEKCVPPKPTCPEGTLKGEQCVVEVEEASKECCAPGFRLEGSQCVRIEVTAPQISCEGECYITHSSAVAYACPVDSEFVADDARPTCVRHTNGVGTDCFTPEKPQCVADGTCAHEATTPAPPARCNPTKEIVAAEPYCPDGGVLAEGRCVFREPIVPTRSCAVGTLDEVTGQCTRKTTTPLKFECPAGTTRRGKRCFTEEQRTPVYVCPEGADETAAGVCTVRTDAIAVPNKVEQIAPSYRCPEGSVQDGKQCLFSSTVEVPVICPDGTEETYNGCEKSAALIVPPPVEKPARPVFHCATQDAVLEGRECTITSRIAAEPYCANDSVLQHNECVRSAPLVETPCKTLTAAPSPVCDSRTAELRGGICIEHDEIEPYVSCGSGFQLNADGKCEKRTVKTPLCPIGTEMQGDGCVRRVEVAPTVRVINGCEVAQQTKPVCYGGY